MRLDRTRFGAHLILQLTAAVAILALSACDQLDPIKTTDLCAREGDISENCPQCLMTPMAPGCPQCRVDEPPAGCLIDPATAEGATSGDPSAEGGSSGSGTTPNPTGGAAANGGNGSSQGGRSGTAGAAPGGAGTPASAGSAGMNAGGAANGASAGTPGQPANTGCTPTSCVEPGMKACLPTGVCGECIDESTCPEGVCDRTRFRCVGCMESADCKDNKVCETLSKTCVECRESVDCRTGELRTCDTQKNTCVECLDGTTPNGCTTGEKPACSMQKCVGCTADTYCTTGTKRVCNEEEQTCVECKRDSDCQRNVPERPVCLTDEHQCVQCNADTDCPDPNNSHCNPTNHQCEPCSAVDQCKHISGLTVCDVRARKCVECDDGQDVCGGKACILATKKCSTVPYASRLECEPCASRTECSSAECVRLSFQGPGGAVDEGGRCLRSASLRCGKPNSRTLTGARTLDGTTVSVCAPSTLTSCTALLDSRTDKPCSGAADCGLSRDDGVCPTSGRCTTSCTSSNDCDVSCTNTRCD